MSTRIELPDLKPPHRPGRSTVEDVPAVEYEEARLPGAINIPPKQLDQKTTSLARKPPVQPQHELITAAQSPGPTSSPAA